MQNFLSFDRENILMHERSRATVLPWEINIQLSDVWSDTVQQWNGFIFALVTATYLFILTIE